MDWSGFFNDPRMFQNIGMLLGQFGGAIPNPLQGVGQMAAQYFAGQKYSDLINQQSGLNPSEIKIKFPELQKQGGQPQAQAQPQAQSQAQPQPAPAQQSQAQPAQTDMMQSVLPQLLSNPAAIQQVLGSQESWQNFPTQPLPAQVNLGEVSGSPAVQQGPVGSGMMIPGGAVPIDKLTAAGLTPQQIQSAVQLGAAMREEPLNQMYKQALINESMMRSGIAPQELGLRAQQLQQQQWYQQQQVGLERQRVGLAQQEMGIRQQLASEELKTNPVKRQVLEEELKRNQFARSELERQSAIMKTLPPQMVGGQQVSAELLGSDYFKRVGVAESLAGQKQEMNLGNLTQKLFSDLSSNPMYASKYTPDQLMSMAAQMAQRYLMGAGGVGAGQMPGNASTGAGNPLGLKIK